MNSSKKCSLIMVQSQLLNIFTDCLIILFLDHSAYHGHDLYPKSSGLNNLNILAFPSMISSALTSALFIVEIILQEILYGTLGHTYNQSMIFLYFYFMEWNS